MSAEPQSTQRNSRAARRGVAKWLIRLTVGALALAVVYHAWIFVRVVWWRTNNPATTAFMEQGLVRLRAKNAKAQLRQQWVAYERISAHLKRAVIAAEDQKFLDHEGFDWEELEKAFEANQRRGRIRRGGSTISQQLAKNLFLSGERSYLRKGQEAVITAMIELTMEKRRILEIYLNVAEWGPGGIFGIEAGSRRAFGKPAGSLGAAEAALMAAMLPNPVRRDAKSPGPGLRALAGLYVARARRAGGADDCLRQKP